MPFPQVLAGAWQILGGWWRSGWLWCCGRSCWWCSRRMTKQSSSAGSGRGRRGPVREGYKVVALLLKPSLGLFGLVGQRRVLLPHPGSATGHLIAPGDYHTLQHIQVHFSVDFQADFKDVRWHDMALTWNHTKDHNRSWKLCFHHPGHVPVIRGNPAMVLAVITWIGKEHELYSGAYPISLVEHCVTFRHDRRLLYSYGPPHMAVQKQDDQHKHTFSNYVRIRDVVQKTCLKRWTIGKSGERGSGISVLPARHDDDDDCSWDLYTTGQIVDGLQQRRNLVFIKRKWNHVVFSRATILSFHPVYIISRKKQYSISSG